MKTSVGIFTARSQARTAVDRLRSAGIPADRINLLTPGDWEGHIAEVPTSDTEQPGTASAVGGVVGGAMGASAGFGLGPILAGLLIPGVGAVTAIGFAAAALLGIGGAFGGAAAGHAMEESLSDGLPKDELYVYEDALRKGKSVVVALLDSDEEAASAGRVMESAGSESLDAARDQWWVGLRDSEQADYESHGGERFPVVERMYRCGFEAAQRPGLIGKDYDEVKDELREAYLDCWENQAFRRGFERGRELRARNVSRDEELAAR
ncbi:MAG TPA: hypothetical protein VFS34_00735 [Thermoanaerobaculia bacterium]|nr:hypothetical protein [Thermoanaerobaculia bacterium]